MSTDRTAAPAARPLWLSKWYVYLLLSVGALLLLLLAGLVLALRAAAGDGEYEGTRLEGPAPNFRLTDQHGKQVSLSDYRGKAVVLAFMDSKCRDVCPITSQYLREAEQMLGREADSVVFLGINVNPEANSVSDMAEATRKWQLEGVPSWHFLTGSKAELEPVWKQYSAVATGPSVYPTEVAGHLDAQDADHSHGEEGAPLASGQHPDEILHSPGVHIISPSGEKQWYVSVPYIPNYNGPSLSELIVRHTRDSLSAGQ